MGYRSSYDFPDTPGNRTGHVAAIALIWGTFGWIAAAIMVGAGGNWLVPWIVGFVMIFINRPYLHLRSSL